VGQVSCRERVVEVGKMNGFDIRLSGFQRGGLTVYGNRRGGGCETLRTCHIMWDQEQGNPLFEPHLHR
jgi:hypothetical protein